MTTLTAVLTARPFATPTIAAASDRPDITLPLTIVVALGILYLVLTILRPIAVLLARLTQLSFTIGTAVVAVIFIGVLLASGVLTQLIHSGFPAG